MTFPSSSFRASLLMLTCASLAVLAACSDGGKDKPATQAAARVNKSEVTVHQINLVLQQQRNLRPEQADAASRQILERLIDQELAVQKAEDQKLDRDPRVVMQVDAARREILARAYAEKVSETAPKPAEDEVRKFYEDKPALFKQRRIFSIQEILIEAKPDQVPLLRERLTSSKSVAEFAEYLKANDYRFAVNQAVRTPEQLPAPVLDTMAKMNDGQATVLQGPSGVTVLALMGSRAQPMTLEQATPAIGNLLLSERRRKLLDDDLKALRAGAKVEYLGKFAEGPRPGAAASAAAPSGASAPGLSQGDISKGLGLK